MRIRSIKYKSSMSNLNSEPKSRPFSFYERGNMMKSETTEIYPNIYFNGEKRYQKQMFTEQCFNFEKKEGTEQDFRAEKKRESFVHGAGHIREAIKSEKIAAKGISLHEGHGDKENRTSILHKKSKPFSKGFEFYSTPQPCNGLKVQKLRFRLSKFSQLIIAQKTSQDSKSQLTNQDNLVDGKDEIILGENLTYNAQSLGIALVQIEQQTKKQHKKIEKIRKQLVAFGPKIQRQLERIVNDFKKGIDLINQSMSKEKSEKCTILMNWKNALDLKAKQYKEETEIIEEIDAFVNRVKNNIEGVGDGQVLNFDRVVEDGK